MTPWIIDRIFEALDQAELARTVSHDIDDRAVRNAMLQLAEDLELFARRLTERVAEIDNLLPRLRSTESAD